MAFAFSKGHGYRERILRRDCQAVVRRALACALSRFAFSQSANPGAICGPQN